jgi:hypothetical protein
MFKLALSTKNELANSRVKSIGTDNEIEVTSGSTFESHADRFFRLINPGHAVAENGLDLAFNFVEDGLSEVSATKADEAAVRRPDKHLGREPCDPSAASVYNPYFLYPVSLADDFGKQTHTLCNVETGTPEVNNITTGPQPGRPFHNCRDQTVMVEPVGESRSSDPSAHNQDSHAENQNTPILHAELNV